MANQGNNTVTELSASTGELVRVISATAPYEFQGIDGISSDGTDVWVANYVGSVTELSASTGDLVQVIRDANLGGVGDEDLGGQLPNAISSDGTDVWVTETGDQVTELSAATGEVVRTISGSNFDFDYPQSVSSDGTDVWVYNDDGYSVTELSASTGDLVRVISGSKSTTLIFCPRLLRTAPMFGWRPTTTR